MQVEKKIRTPRQAPDGEDPARILSQRAIEGDPARARQCRRGRRGRRARRARPQDRAHQALQGSADQGQFGAEEAARDGADVGRGDGQPQLSRRAARPALGQEIEAEARHRRGRADPRRGPLRPREGQGADRRISRRPGPHQQAEGPDPVPGRPARRRQDLAGPLDRAGDRARVRPPVAGRGPRRGRDPRPPPHLYRLAAGQDRHQPQEGRHLQPALPARRDRQARPGFPRRSRLGAARSARSRAEQPLPGPLSGGRLRPFRRDVRHHRELDGHAAALARPDGDHPPRRLYRGREGRDRQAPSHPQADRIARPQGGRADPDRGRACAR